MDPELLLEALVRYVGQLRSVRRELGVSLTPRRGRHSGLLTGLGVRRHQEDLASEVDGYEVAGRGGTEPFYSTLHFDPLDQVGRRLKVHVDGELLWPAIWQVERPELVLLREDDRASVVTDGRVLRATGREVGNLRGGASLGTDPPNVEDSVALRDVIDHPVHTPHWNRVVHVLSKVFEVRIGQLSDLARREVLHENLGAVVTPVLLPCRAHGTSVEGHHGSRGVDHGAPSLVHSHRRRNPTGDRHHVHGRVERMRVSGGDEEHRAAVRRPTPHDVTPGVEGELSGLATVDRNDEHVVIPEAVARERDPSTVRRKARSDLSGHVRGESSPVQAVLVRDPDVTVIREDDHAVPDVRVAHEPDLISHCFGWPARDQQE